MVDTEIFSRRLDALEGYLERLQSLSINHRIAYAAIRDELDDLVAFRIWALGKIAP